MKKYEVIGEDDVFKVLTSCSIDFTAPIDCINLVNIASILRTSRYQVKKHIDTLVSKGIAVYQVVYIPDEYENLPPYHGYRLADTVKVKSGNEGLPRNHRRSEILRRRAMYQVAVEKHNRIIEQVFGSEN